MKDPKFLNHCGVGHHLLIRRIGSNAKHFGLLPKQEIRLQPHILTYKGYFA